MITDGVTGLPWTRAEVEAIVEVYFRMLRMQEMGQHVQKTVHNRALQTVIPARNLQAIEYKHRNISAVLNLYGVQALSGYSPLPNFQRILLDVVGEALTRDATLDKIALQSVEKPAEPPLISNFGNFVVPAPAARASISDEREDLFRSRLIKKDYLEREARNRSLGLAGELTVMQFEEHRLRTLGKGTLASRIEHVSQSQGDGAGYDILSFDDDGRERFIEVKTTAYAAETPFFITPNEIKFSDQQASQFHLYRVFSFRDTPKMFALSGPIAANCRLDPVSFRASLLGKAARGP